MNWYKILLVLCFAYSLNYKGQSLPVQIKPNLVIIFYLTGLTFGKPRYAGFLYVYPLRNLMRSLYIYVQWIGFNVISVK